jgi:hypothetical protein
MGLAALLLGMFFVVGGPLVGRAAAAPPAADPAKIPGVYECRGMGADGRPYQGAVIIEPDGERFFVQWIVGAQRAAIGLGIRDGDMLAVSFYSADAGGIVLYRIEGERLVGHWSAPLTDGQLFEETLTRMGDVPPAAPKAAPAPEAAPAPARPSRPRPSGATRPVLWRP